MIKSHKLYRLYYVYMVYFLSKKGEIMGKSSMFRVLTAVQTVIAAVLLCMSFVSGIVGGAGANLHTVMTEQFGDMGCAVFWCYFATAAAMVLCCSVQLISNNKIFLAKWTLAIPTAVFGLGMVMIMSINTCGGTVTPGVLAGTIILLAAPVFADLYKKYK